MAVDPCACRDKHCAQKNEDSAAAKIHTNKLLDKAFFKMQCPSFEHQFCERDVNCGFDHDVASNQRRTAGADDCDNINIPADDLPAEHKQVVKSGRQKAALQSGATKGKKARDDRDIYGMHNCDPHKYFKSGYGGFVPFTADLVGMNSTAESHVGANRMTDFQDKMACLEAMCREKYLNFDPCSVTAEDVKRGPGWMQPDKAYAKCLKDGFNTADGAGTSLNIGYRCESDKNRELPALMEADFAAMDAEAGDDPCPKGKGDKCTCSEEEKRKFAEQKKKDDCQQTSKCPSEDRHWTARGVRQAPRHDSRLRRPRSRHSYLHARRQLWQSDQKSAQADRFQREAWQKKRLLKGKMALPTIRVSSSMIFLS